MLRAYTQSRKARVGVINTVDLGHCVSASLKGSSEPTRGYFRPEDVSDGKVNVLVIGEDKHCYAITYNSSEDAHGFMPIVVMIPQEFVEFT
jgi:hypothetical protein